MVKRKRSGGGGRSAPRAIRKKPRRYKTKNLTLSKPMKSLVNREINRQNETHERLFYSGIVNVDSAIGNADWSLIIPATVQGDARENRMGAELTLTSLIIRGFIRMTPDGSSTGDALMARLMVVSAKRQARHVNVTDLSNSLLREGSQPRTYDGTLEHHYMPTNTAYITKHFDRSYIMATDHITYVDGGTGGDSEDTRVAQRIVIKPFTIRLKVRGKKLRYENNSSQYPENFSPLIGLGFANMNTNAFDANTRLSYFFHVTMRWKE